MAALADELVSEGILAAPVRLMVDGPLLRRALFRCHLWASARLMPAFDRRRNFEEVLKLAPLASPTPLSRPAGQLHRRPRQPHGAPSLADARPQMLREGLLGLRFLRLAGFDPELRFGVDPKSLQTPRVSAHCWVCLDGRPVVSDSLPGMVEIYRHHPSAKVRPA